MKQNCPHCGNPIRISIAKSPHYLPGRWQNLASSSRNVLFQETGERSVPRHPGTVRTAPLPPISKETDVWVPFLIACITCVASMIISFCFAVIVFDARRPVEVSVISGVVGFALPWARKLLNWSRQLRITECAEVVIGRDLDGDGNVGVPQPRTWKVEVETETADGWSLTRLPCPVGGFAYLRQFAEDVLLNDGDKRLGVTFSEDGAQRSGGYTRDLWKELRDVFLTQGWCYWRNAAHERQGVELTLAGKSVLRQLANGENIPID